jgi:hypothetical protein
MELIFSKNTLTTIFVLNLNANSYNSNFERQITDDDAERLQ